MVKEDPAWYRPIHVWPGKWLLNGGSVYRHMTKWWVNITCANSRNTHTHTHLTALCLGLPVWAGTRKVKPVWILLKQETVSGSGISWAICKSAPCSRPITTPACHHSVFLTGQMPFLSPNLQHQSTEGRNSRKQNKLSRLQIFMNQHSIVGQRKCWTSAQPLTPGEQI